MSDTNHSNPLAESLVFTGDGHLADLGVSIYADAELGLLPSSAIEHGEACETCALRIGELALESRALRTDLRAAVAAAAMNQAKFPTWAVGLVAALGTLFAIPVFGETLSTAHAQGAELAHSAPLALRSFQSSLSTSGALLVCMSVLALLTCTLLGRRLLTGRA